MQIAKALMTTAQKVVFYFTNKGIYPCNLFLLGRQAPAS